ncbi:unnamed protein product [Linum trigynum]|uniref:Uncharacterized protein n=1 Tax=Linum trigynum TaxID=586398 RepID=A0AAV2D1X0_9ROSI
MSSLSLLYSRLSSSSPPISRHRPRLTSPRRRSNANSTSIICANPLISDSSNDNNSIPGDDAPAKIDEFDNLEDQTDTAAAVNEDCDMSRTRGYNLAAGGSGGGNKVSNKPNCFMRLVRERRGKSPTTKPNPPIPK